MSTLTEKTTNDFVADASRSPIWDAVVYQRLFKLEEIQRTARQLATTLERFAPGICESARAELQRLIADLDSFT